MAELAIGILGISLAWKGIIDFGKVISRLTDCDNRERYILAIGLESSQLILKDWGDYWGVDRADGRFHHLEETRKNIVMEIIFQLHDSRERAIKRLRKSHGLFKKEEEEEEGCNARGDRLSRLVESFVGTAQKNKKKIRWISGDDKLVSTLVEETMKLHGWLDRLTSMSINFLATHFDTPRDARSLELRLENVEHLMREQVLTRVVISNRPCAASVTPSDDAIDDKTLAGYATDSIMSSKQRECILENIDRSLDYYGDVRVSEKVTAWWNDVCSDILILELPDEADSQTAMSICVLLYYFTKCHKLIFVFDAQSREESVRQFLSMIRTFIQNLVSLRGNKPLDGLPLPMNIADMDAQDLDTSAIQHIVRFFHGLLRDTLESGDQRVLLVVSGLDVNGSNDCGFIQLVQMFISGIQDVCDSQINGQGVIFKALFTHRGYASSLYDCVKVTSFADLTDHASRVGSLAEDLASLPDI
jgi:hypothetical protein